MKQTAGAETLAATDRESWEWSLIREDLSAQAIVEETYALLEAVCVRLGESVDRALLVEGLERCLSTDGREATLSLGAFRDRPRRELARRAEEIGRQLVDWARSANDSRVALGRYGADRLHRLDFESICAGHSWSPEVASLLFGPAGGRLVVQLYNEWMHQLVLLRDMLLPFEDWRARVFATSQLGEGRGLRAFDDASLAFYSEIGSRLPPARSLARLADTVERLPVATASGQRSTPAHVPGAHPRLLDNELLRVFLTVVRTGGFTAAALVLNRTQAGVSMQVKRLEELAQVQLLRRGGRGVQLTAEGQTMLTIADRMLSLNDEAFAQLSVGHVAGPVRLATNAPLAQSLLPTLAARFQQAHPEAWVEATVLPTMAAAARSLHGDADLVLDYVPDVGGGAEPIGRRHCNGAPARP